MSRHYSSAGGVMDGEYPVRVHLASDGKLFCSLEDADGESIFPGNIEYIEWEVFDESPWDREPNLEALLTPEGDREEPPPVVGKAVYEDGVMQSIEIDLSEVPGHE